MIYVTYRRHDKDEFVNAVTLFEMPYGVYLVDMGTPDLNPGDFNHWHPTLLDAQLWMETRYGVPLDVWVPLSEEVLRFFDPQPRTNEFYKWAHTIAEAIIWFWNGDETFEDFMFSSIGLPVTMTIRLDRLIQTLFKKHLSLGYNFWLNLPFIEKLMEEKKPNRVIDVMSSYSNWSRIALKWYLMQHYPYYPWHGKGVEVDDT
ncbi:MAG: hypothetical protein AAFV33_12830 [Chloroflexota bacterium]